MAKDDYDVLVCKVLVYLYRKLKGKGEIDPHYLLPRTKDFPIDEEYFEYVLMSLYKECLIENITVFKVWGGDEIISNIDKIRITPKGIAHLRDNSLMEKIAQTIPEAASIASLFLK